MYLLWLISFLSSAETLNVSKLKPDCDSVYRETYTSAFEFVLKLVTSKETYMRPFIDGLPSFVYVDMYVTSIADVNEKAQTLSTQVKLVTAWFNGIPLWEYYEECGFELFHANKELFWTPDLLIKESIKTDYGTTPSPYLQLHIWPISVSIDILALTTACRMDLYKFPFDTQTCNITFHSAVHTSKELVIHPLSEAKFITQDSKHLFEAQGEWELLLINPSNFNGTVLGNLHDLLVYQITIKRRPLLYVINIIIPVFFFLVLDVTSFFIDANGADKLSFKVTLLLAISVLLLILNDTLPSTADKLPLIGIYCSVIFSLIGIGILETIIVNYLMAKGAERRSAALMEKTAAVTGRDDSVRNQQILPDSIRDENEINSSLYWVRVARVTDVAFFILYIITIIVFLSVLGKNWIS
ncbi:5-hydroxytryptamine receptor 3A [Danio aesculapii]|uniref:5-hydroxytryptamine receptor 3A n=1 Tax=Danio aesculapii TaxID=1142201 RepID=UPI0024C061FC|nr:5-hydroxytryptamine receptor 3A [Danio aesculapii]